jgi:hypothetical protein
MSTATNTATVDTVPVKPRSLGRNYLWSGIGLSLLGIAVYAIQVVLGHLFVPWYLLIVLTGGVLLIARSIVLRRTVTRIIVLGMFGLLTGFEWYFLLSLSRLPAYDGPARVGQAIPSFRTELADGRAFSDADLRDGKTTVLTFFRGRW